MDTGPGIVQAMLDLLSSYTWVFFLIAFLSIAMFFARVFGDEFRRNMQLLKDNHEKSKNDEKPKRIPVRLASDGELEAVNEQDVMSLDELLGEQEGINEENP